MTYLKEEIDKIFDKLPKKNIHVSSWSMRVNWGTNAFLEMYLKVLKDLVKFKTEKIWEWDFVINLSESDFPIK